MVQLRDRAIADVINERDRQDGLWGEQDHRPEKWTAIIGEEFGELCQAVVETIFDNGRDRASVGGFCNIRMEAVHVAAVAVAMIECIDRYNDLPWHTKLNQLK